MVPALFIDYGVSPVAMFFLVARGQGVMSQVGIVVVVCVASFWGFTFFKIKGNKEGEAIESLAEKRKRLTNHILIRPAGCVIL